MTATDPTPTPDPQDAPVMNAPVAADDTAAAAAQDVAAAAETSPVPAPAGAAKVELSPAACAERLRALFPALFAGPAKPIKLRIQADIQARAAGEFTKAALSGFLRRHTGSTGYLIALTKAPQRLDLDGQPAGEISAEHRQAAADELARRRQLHDQRRQAEDQQRQAEEGQRRERALLLRAFRSTTLTKDNFCALKGMTPEALDALLAQAEQEAQQAPPQRQWPDDRPRHAPGGPRRDGGSPERGGRDRRDP
ncbi:MAG: ProQ/FINO family protein, partial [Pseudomonadota bacterium]